MYNCGDSVEVLTVREPDTWRKAIVKSTYWGEYANVILPSGLIITVHFSNMRPIEKEG